MSFVIRRIRNGDREAFIELSCGLRIYNYYSRPESERTYRLEDRLHEATEWCNSHFDELLSSTTQCVFMAYMDEKPAGYAIAYCYPKDPGLLDELFVAESFRKQRIGKALIKAVSEWLRNTGSKKMRLNVFQWNRNAQAFYESEGFEKYIVTYSKLL